MGFPIENGMTLDYLILRGTEVIGLQVCFEMLLLRVAQSIDAFLVP